MKTRQWEGRFARAVEMSQNSKTGPMSATYAAAGSCPQGCRFNTPGGPCYGRRGRVGIKVNTMAMGTAQAIAQAEADEIDKLTGALDLRLHVHGDCATPQAAELVAEAARRYKRRTRGRRDIFGYTAAWRDVERSTWRGVSMLASVSTFDEGREARERGYQPAIVVKSHPASGKAWRDVHGQLWIPCPQETRGIQCVRCRLCLNGSETAGIAFKSKHKAQAVQGGE